MALTPEGTPYVESTDLVANYPAASLSLANRLDLVGVLPFATSAARATAIPSPTDGQYSYLQDTNATEFWNGSAWQALGGGKILQVVRATDTTSRSTSSATFVDVTGMSVTITPTKNTSTVLILAVFLFTGNGTSPIGRFAITDAANNQISGGNAPYAGGTYNSPNIPLTLVAYDSPATTSAETYKLRFELTQGSTVFARNDLADGQMYAIEVSA